MTRRMLIDATHPEETRAVVLDDNHLVDFDFETSTKKQLKGNIYLAKVTRVEPSLQAAFVEYGGNRHGFLAFSEIHPDYYQIPQADRALLEDLEQETAATRANAADADDANGANGHDDSAEDDADAERSDLMDEAARRRSRLLRSYKIQEVVKRRQIMLVQVVKEERGNKGAALTTYLSLAGRYCVLMPNTPRGGGISRKISSVEDRRRLKDIAQELEIPQGMGLIIRTAGQERTRAEIRRDYEYLLRLWNEIRETTLKSVAPKLIYEEGDLIKRALRDLYTRDIEEVICEGEEGYKSARRLMQMLMPSRVRVVKKHEDELPLFVLHRVEEQLDGMHSPTVRLPSGGSIVIHTTEALTAIDVNSGRSTRERHIDETAVKTNLEAADEVARQLRLRDLAGLIVIDFIDMAEARHQRAVEKRMRDALKFDRARIQVGKISTFGLLELSRQRLRASLQELSSQICPHCAGMGVVRSTESCALQALRAIQEEGIRREAAAMRIVLPPDVALYVLNQKREALSRLEERYQMRVMVGVGIDLVPPTMEMELLERRERGEEVHAPAPAPITSVATAEEREDYREPVEAEPADRSRRRAPVAAAAAEAPVSGGEVAAREEGEEGQKRRRRRRRRRRRGGEVAGQAPLTAAEAAQLDAEEGEDEGEGEEPIGPEEMPQPAIDEPVPEFVIAADAVMPPSPAPVLAEQPSIVAVAVELEDVAPEAEAAVAEPVAEAAPPKRRRAPAKAKEPKEPKPPEEPKAAKPPKEPKSPKEPKAVKEPKPAKEKAATPARRTRKPKAELPVDAEPVPVELAIPAAAPEPVETPEPLAMVAEPATRNGPVAEPASEPAPTVEEPEAALVADEPARPARQGWWSRLVR